MGDTRDDPYAARRGELEREFQSLPAAGTAAYWAHIETSDTQRVLALEVLGRCIRERLAAGDRASAERIVSVILGRVAPRVERGARQAARGVRDGRAQVEEDITQETYITLWQALTNPQQVFLLENFMHALDRMQQHVVNGLLLRLGAKQRPGVEHSTRVPTSRTDSLDAPPRAEDQLPLSERLVDPHAQDAFEQADASDQMDLINELPEERRSVIYERYILEFSAEEIARARGVTAHTVRNWLKAIQAELQRDYQGGEEAEHGPN